jgi:hypothetical protein
MPHRPKLMISMPNITVRTIYLAYLRNWFTAPAGLVDG